MADNYYKPCKEFDICNELMAKYWESKQYDKCFEGHLALAEKGYPLAECTAPLCADSTKKSPGRKY